MSRVSLNPAFILHTRPYRDSSLLLDILTQDHGRISGLIRGVKRPHSPLRGLVQPFIPLLISWSGKTELMHINGVEPNGISPPFPGNRLISGFYLNELLIRLLHRYDPHPTIYSLYAATIASLCQSSSHYHPTLRSFEFRLLRILGFAPPLNKTYDTSTPVQPNAFYQFKPNQGMTTHFLHQDKTVFSGKNLLAIHTYAFHESEVQQDAKRLIRLLLHTILDKPLKSYEYLG